MQDIRLKAADGAGEFTAYLWKPKGEKQVGAVVLIQEIFGVNESLRATAKSIAEMGFFVLAPDLFWRQEPGVSLTDKSEGEWKKAFALMNGFDQDKGVEDLKVTLAAARDLPGANGNAGTVGFCLGGRLAALMATRSDADVNVAYYGVGLDALIPEFDKLQAPLLLHIAEQDEYSPAEVVEKLLDAVEESELIEAIVYPDVGHAFARVDGMNYDARAAVIANGRTAEILAEMLD